MVTMSNTSVAIETTPFSMCCPGNIQVCNVTHCNVTLRNVTVETQLHVVGVTMIT